MNSVVVSTNRVYESSFNTEFTHFDLFMIGCDGVTYTDRSYAVGAGVNVWHLGDCEETELA